MQPIEKNNNLIKFPKDKYGRCFQPSWYWKSLPGNSHIRRDWLDYLILKTNYIVIIVSFLVIMFKKYGQKKGFQLGQGQP